MDAVALFVAAASFILSVATLWVTALKKAQIGIHYAPQLREWHVGSWTGLTPSGDAFVQVAIYAHNAGARAGILEHINVESTGTMAGALSGPVSWYDTKTHPDTHPSNYRAVFPRAIDANDIQEFHLTGRIVPALTTIQRLTGDEAADIEREEAFAGSLASAEPLAVTVIWGYARPDWSIRGAKTERSVQRTEIQVPAAGLRNAFIQFWSGHTEHPHYGNRAARLVALASGDSA